MLFPDRSTFLKLFKLCLLCFSASLYAQAEEAPHFVFDTIVLDGAKQLSPAEQTQWVKNYLHRSIALPDIHQLVQTVTNRYISRGFITTRVYLQPQNLSGKKLTLTVLEGTIEKLNVLDDGHPRVAKPNMAFPGLTGEVLNLRALEQGIEQISRLPSVQTNIKIEPGTTAGSSVVSITSKHQRPWRLSTSIDNVGGQKPQLEVLAGWDDLMGFYDQWSVFTRRNARFSEKNNITHQYSGTVSIPFGCWTFRWMSTNFDYLREIQGEKHLFSSKGDDWRHEAEVERIIHRNSHSKTSLGGFVATKKASNYINDERLKTSSQSLSRAGIRLSHNRRLWGGALDASLTGEQGFPTFGARAAFTKWNTQIHYRKPFAIGQRPMAFDSSLLGQWASNTLYGSERLSIGDHSTVRGFRESSISGDRGGFVRNELSGNLLGPVDLFAGVDAGWIVKNQKNPSEHGAVVGAAAGLRAHGNLFFGELSIEKSLAAPSFTRKEKPTLFFKIGIPLEKIGVHP